jgi:hypothetical protein
VVDHDYMMGYYIADGIFLQWSTFVKTILAPLGAKMKHYIATQESTRKDVKHEFEVLQARCFKVPELKQIMKACLILCNMIIENE